MDVTYPSQQNMFVWKIYQVPRLHERKNQNRHRRIQLRSTSKDETVRSVLTTTEDRRSVLQDDRFENPTTHENDCRRVRWRVMENERQGVCVKSSREEILRLFQENEKRNCRQMDERV